MCFLVGKVTIIEIVDIRLEFSPAFRPEVRLEFSPATRPGFRLELVLNLGMIPNSGPVLQS